MRLSVSLMFHAARLINGIGTGMLNVIVPVWVSILLLTSIVCRLLKLGMRQSTETAPHTSRGQFVSIEFFLNIFGVVVAYWLGL